METEPGDSPKRRRVLFVCVGNACRSQFAEALSRQLAADIIEPASAGLYPLGYIAETTLAVGQELGLSFEGQTSKRLSAGHFEWAELIVNLTGIPTPTAFETEKPVMDWSVDDPYGGELEEYRRTAAEIEARILDLAAGFRTERAHSSAG
jgi:arsenate reductase